MLSGILSHINKKSGITEFTKRVNSVLIIVFLNLILLNSINFFSYINILNSESLKESDKTLIEALVDNFIKVPEAEKDPKDLNESDEVVVYSLNEYSFNNFIIDNTTKDILLPSFYGVPSEDVTTPPPRRNS